MSGIEVKVGVAREKGTANSIEPVLGQVLEAIKTTDRLSRAEKEQMREWSIETYGDLWTQLEQLRDMIPPEKLVTIWDTFLQIISNLPM